MSTSKEEMFVAVLLATWELEWTYNFHRVLKIYVEKENETENEKKKKIPSLSLRKWGTNLGDNIYILFRMLIRRNCSSSLRRTTNFILLEALCMYVIPILSTTFPTFSTLITAFHTTIRIHVSVARTTSLRRSWRYRRSCRYTGAWRVATWENA